MPDHPPSRSRSSFGLWIVLTVSLAYCVWLGSHWLTLDWSDRELAGLASRVWDIKKEVQDHHQLPWWSPYFMSGSSYALLHTHSFYMLPWLLFMTFTSLLTAGKLVGLCAIFASPVAMYFCARYFLQKCGARAEWAAVFSALVYLLQPEQLTRTATAEHLTIALSLPLVPLGWWLFARALDTARWRDAFWCALVYAVAFWVDNKQLVVQGVFWFGYLLYWIWTRRTPAGWPVRRALQVCVITGLFTVALAAFAIVPALLESKAVKLFKGDPMAGWQQTYSFKNLFAMVDRNGVFYQGAADGVTQALREQRYRPTTNAEADQLRADIQRVFSLQIDSPEKYAGVVVLGLLAVTILFNRHRVDRRLFWFLVGMVLLAVMLAAGVSNVWDATLQTWSAFINLAGVPDSTRTAVFVALAVAVVFLVLFARRKLTSRQKWLFVTSALVVFLFIPAFKLLAALPYFKEIRAPGVFYAVPITFLLALLSGFFVSDVLTGEKWRPRLPWIVMGLTIAVMIDFWPYQRAMKSSVVPARTLANLETAYTALRADTEWTKTYSLSGRYFHLLGPMWSDKPQVYEAFLNWMCPLGTGLLNQAAWQSLDSHRAFLNLLGTRYVVFDKTDPSNAGQQQILSAYRQMFPTVTVENEDFVIFRNPTANDYLTAYRRAYLDSGDLRQSAPVALTLAARDWPVVYEPVADCERSFPSRPGQRVALTGVQLTRVNHGTIQIAAAAPEPCLAVIAESWYPFWKATVNGQPARVLRVSTGLMGLELPAGTHQIELRYQPPRIYFVAASVSLLSLIGAGFCLVRRRQPLA